MRAQQRSIIGKIRERDLAGARWLMSEMIASQRSYSTPEQIAKSLSNMAQQANLHDVPDLQLEWSHEATEVNPHDPLTFGHLANALIDAGRYGEAETALDAVALRGDPLFAATGRARILRALGRLTEARDAFVAAAQEYDGIPEVVHARLGAAEALRELGDTQGALTEYQQISERWPLEVSGWNGLASTLMDLGRIDLALQTYSKAATHERGALARVGNANAYRIIGDLDRALNLYETVLVEYPNNRFALCGRADVLRDQGKFVAALAAYELAAECSPYRVEPVLGKARTLRLMARLIEALTVYEEARSRFPSDRRVAAGFVAVYRAQGRFEEALAAVDRLIAEYPFDAHFRVVRAGILSRLGKDSEALAIYDAILAKKSTFAQAALGKAALLIKLQRDSEAAILLPEKRSKTRRDWRQLLLKAFLVENRQGARAASYMLRLQIPVCPFALERRAMCDLLATLELRSGRSEQARQVVESNPEEVSNVIALHVLAATHRAEQARVRLEHVRESGGPKEILDLAEEIARRHKLNPELPHHSVDWSQTAERNLMLAEAA